MKLTPFAASTLGVILLLSIGFLGPPHLTGKIVDIEQVVQQLQQKTQNDIRQAQQTLPPTAQPFYITILQQAQQKIDQNAQSWTQKASGQICKLLLKATSADMLINQLMPQLERSMQAVAQQIITIVIKQNIILQQSDPAAQQKISDAQTIANAAVKPLATYGAQQILINAIKQCPKEELPPSAADTLPETRQTKRAAPASTTTTYYERQSQPPSEGPISGGGIGATPTQGPDVSLKDVLFYYENAMSMWVDKDKLEPTSRLAPSIMVKNLGNIEAKDVEVAVSVDSGTEEKKTLAKLAPGGASGYGFFLPAGLSGGQHELTIRLTAKDDINTDNNVAKIPFTILIDGTVKDLKFSYVNEQRTVLNTPVDTNAIDPALNLVATLYATNEGRTPIQKADMVMSVDNGQPQRQTIFGNSRYVSFDVKNLVPGTHELSFSLELIGDTNPSNNVVKKTITVPQTIQTPTQPAVEQPKPAQNVDVGFKDAVFYYKRDPYTPIDKNAVEQSYDKLMDVTVTNFGTEEAKTVDVYIREDDRTLEVKRFLVNELQPGTSKTKQFIDRDTMPSELGKHKLTFRLETKGDTNPANNIGIVDFNIIETPEQQLWPDLKLWFTKDKPLEQDGIQLGLNEVKANKAIFGGISLKNIAKHEKSTNAVVTIKIDDKEIFREKIDEVWPADWQASKDKILTFATQALTAGVHKFVATAIADKDANLADNTITADIIVAEEKPIAPPVVEQPKPQPKEDLAFEKVVLAQGVAEYDFGPEGKLVNEQYNIILRMYTTPVNLQAFFKTFIDGKQYDPKYISSVFVPKQHTAIDLGTLSAGKHHLKIVLDHLNEHYETNENNNVFETDFWVKAAPVTPIQQPLPPTTEPMGDLQIKPAGEQWLSDFDTRAVVLPTQIKTDQRFSGEVSIKNIGNKEIIPTFIVKFDDTIIHQQTHWAMKPQETYSTSFGSGNRKYWPGKHKITLIAQADNDRNPADNTFVVDVSVIDPTTGSATPPTPTQDVRFDKVTLAQYFAVINDYWDVDFGPDGRIAVEEVDIRIRMYRPKELSTSFDTRVLIDGQPAKIKAVTSSPYPAPHSVIEIEPLSAGKHHLKIILDPDNRVYEGPEGEANNVFETDFWVKEKPNDIELQPGSFAQFDDAKVKQTGKNTLQLGIGYDIRGNIPASLPITIKLPDKTQTKIIDVKQYSGGVTGKWGRYDEEIPVDRNKFPTHVYVSIDFPDADKTNNAILIPVIVLKDRKVYKIT